MATRLFDTGSDDVLYLIDLSGYVFRAFHAMPPLTSPSGEPTHAILGTVNMLERLIRQCRPAMLAVAMDSRTKTFRKEMYPDYKANRPPVPDELKQQMKRIGELVEAFPIPIFQKDGFEADDLIASVVAKSKELQMRIVIVSADKDLMQLVSEDVIMWDTMRDRVFGPPEASARFGVPVPQIRDVLALMGDSSDNVPGVPSVGPKTAKDLIEQYETIDGVYAHIDEIKRKKLRETLIANEDKARLSQTLVTLKADITVELDPAKLRYGQRNTARLRELYSELGFQRHLSALDREAGEMPTDSVKPKLADVHAHAVTTQAKLQELGLAIKEAGRAAFFPVTLGPSSMKTTLIGLGVCCDDQTGFYIPLQHRALEMPQQVTEESMLSWLTELWADPNLLLGGYDIKELFVLLSQRGVPIRKATFDLMLTSQLLDPSAGATLERLAQDSLGLTLSTIDDLTKTPGKRGRLPLDEVAVDEMTPYAALRGVCIFGLWDSHLEKLEEDQLTGIWEDIERPLIPLLTHLQLEGIKLDTESLVTLGAEVGKSLQTLEERAHSIAGKDFNVNSPRQLEKILFDDLGLKPIKRTKTSRSTDAATLEALSSEHPLPQVVVEIRQLSKLKGTYIDALPGLVDTKTGRLHSVWHQHGAATGRFSSSDPNLQNIPIRSELGSRIRAAFIAPEGYSLVSADYSQIELRVLAHLSQDPVLLDAFRTQQDIHLRTAMEIFEVDESEVDDELRRRAKAVNFGVIYGQGDSALAKSLGISRVEAGQFIAAYFRRYAGVRTFMDNTLLSTRASGSVRTLLGRRRIVPDIQSGNRARRLAAERIAMNTPIQGTAADLIKLAMLRFREPVSAGSRMLLTVHDELVFEVPDAEVAEASKKIRTKMESVYALDVPLVVDVGHGPNWRAAH